MQLRKQKLIHSVFAFPFIVSYSRLHLENESIIHQISFNLIGLTSRGDAHMVRTGSTERGDRQRL